MKTTVCNEYFSVPESCVDLLLPGLFHADKSTVAHQQVVFDCSRNNVLPLIASG